MMETCSILVKYGSDLNTEYKKHNVLTIYSHVKLNHGQILCNTTKCKDTEHTVAIRTTRKIPVLCFLFLDWPVDQPCKTPTQHILIAFKRNELSNFMSTQVFHNRREVVFLTYIAHYHQCIWISFSQWFCSYCHCSSYGSILPLHDLHYWYCTPLLHSDQATAPNSTVNHMVLHSLSDFLHWFEIGETYSLIYICININVMFYHVRMKFCYSAHKNDGGFVLLMLGKIDMIFSHYSC